MRALRFILLAAAVIAPSAASADIEHEVKAAFLYRFLSYVEWPENAFKDAGAPLVVGVVGADEVQAALAAIVEGRTAQGRAVEVRKLTTIGAPNGIHMLFVGHDSGIELSRLGRHQGLLVVADDEGSLDRGAMINLVRVGNNVRFQVAPQAAERNGLRISSRMLAVAQLVKPGRP